MARRKKEVDVLHPPAVADDEISSSPPSSPLEKPTVKKTPTHFKVRCIHGEKWLFDKRRFWSASWETIPKDDLTASEWSYWQKDNRVEIEEA